MENKRVEGSSKGSTTTMKGVHPIGLASYPIHIMNLTSLSNSEGRVQFDFRVKRYELAE